MRRPAKALAILALLLVISSLVLGLMVRSDPPSPPTTPPSPPSSEGTCSDGIQNQDETGIDCGGVCNACSPTGDANDTEPFEDTGPIEESPYWSGSGDTGYADSGDEYGYGSGYAAGSGQQDADAGAGEATTSTESSQLTTKSGQEGQAAGAESPSGTLNEGAVLGEGVKKLFSSLASSDASAFRMGVDAVILLILVIIVIDILKVNRLCRQINSTLIGIQAGSQKSEAATNQQHPLSHSADDKHDPISGYVSSCLSKGISIDSVREKLIAAGWSESQVEDVLARELSEKG
ncbi:hypothetical protein AUJ69_04215 [Candidatus Woesearchaeota archaeon CG1_02_47_18]|nr:MAG: hypothetical protein AUJ69_04215 [Candidatus Woesearchaeota archaeon CG1_02_47_18]